MVLGGLPAGAVLPAAVLALLTAPLAAWLAVRAAMRLGTGGAPEAARLALALGLCAAWAWAVPRLWALLSYGGP